MAKTELPASRVHLASKALRAPLASRVLPVLTDPLARLGRSVLPVLPVPLVPPAPMARWDPPVLLVRRASLVLQVRPYRKCIVP